MATCPNKNTAEYAALQKVYKTEVKTNNIIFAWQKTNKTDVFPTVVQAKRYFKNNKVAYALEQKAFGESIIENLKRKKLIHLYKGNYLVKNSFDNSRVYDESALSSNYRKIDSYLRINNISSESADMERTPKSYKFIVYNNSFTPKDMLPSSRQWNEPRSLDVVLHLKRMFPQVNYEMVSEEEAQIIHNKIPEEYRTTSPFSEIKSFYVNGVAYLIRGRVTNETAIEEMLHPFTDAIKAENPVLFNNLLAEAKVNFPEMAYTIKNSYTKEKNFDELDLELEIVTQALVKHFNNEYTDSKPTKTFLNLIEEALEWLKNVINDLHKYITGKALPISSINSNATFTDIAKLLNTEDLEFILAKKASNKVRYSLSPGKQAELDAALEGTVGPQRETILKLFQVAVDSTVVIDSLSVNINPDKTNLTKDEKAALKTVPYLREEDHTYLNITDNKVYISATTAIKGQLTNKEGEAIIARDKAIKGLTGKKLTDAKKEGAEKIKKGKQADIEKLESVQFNLDLGNDIDTLAELAVSIKNGSNANSLESTIPKMKILNADQTAEMMTAMINIIANQMPQGGQGKALTQVVLFDANTGIAGTADLLIVDVDGKISILDLKTSKNSVYSMYPTSTTEGRAGLTYYENMSYSLPADSMLRQLGVERLSTQGQHNLQVNLYRRMLENMGYELNQGDFSASTFHIQLDIEGKGKDQKYLGTWKDEKNKHHNNIYTGTKLSENGVYVDMLMPSTTKPVQEDVLISKPGENASVSPTDPPDAPIDERVDAIAQPELFTIYNALEKSLLILEESSEKNRNKKIYSSGNIKQQKDRIAKLQAFIFNSMNKGPLEQSRAYTAVLRDALTQIRDFTEYISDPKNINNPEFISYVLNFNSFIASFKPLFIVDDVSELNATQKQFVLNLKIETYKLIGEGDESSEGLVDVAIFNFVKELVRRKSNRKYGDNQDASNEFDEERLIQDLTQIEDISNSDLLTRDMATSEDPLLAIVDKIYKRQKQILLDEINFRESETLKLAGILQRLSPGTSKQELYNFMREFDSDGNFNGNYTKLIGQQYYTKRKELYAATRDSNNIPLVMKDIGNLEDASEKDIEDNIDLANKKRAFSNFSLAERSDEEGNYIDGEYHHYSQEFQDERNKFETYVVSRDGYGTWVKKSSLLINEVEYKLFENKYYNFVEYTKILNNAEGTPSGQVEKNVRGRFVKYEYKEPNAWRLDENGNRMPDGDMRSEKYKAIFDLNKTDALSIAQRTFYEFFVRVYETELLTKLGPKVLFEMTGKTPLTKSALATKLKNQPNIAARMWANSTRSVKNFFSETATTKQVLLDDNGEILSGMPVFFTGSPRIDGALEEAQAELQINEDNYKNNKIKSAEYKEQDALITGKIAKLRAQPSLGEISGDLADSLIKFSAMAEHFEIMGQIEDTLNAIQTVIEKRSYEPNAKNLTLTGRVAGVVKKVGFKKGKGANDNTIKRMQKFMTMVYYDNEMMTKGLGAKIADNLITASSLAYVGFNPFGNFNNYLVGRINNNIEMLGSRFYSKKNYFRASKEWNTQAVSGILERTAIGSRDAADLLTLGKLGIGKNDYDPTLPNNKYEAFVELFRMMDSSTDIRESGRADDNASIWERFTSWGYVMQDAAEYNVQTKVGIALLMDTNLYNEATNTTMSLYDAFTFNTGTHELDLMSGYNQVINKDGTKEEYNDNFRYEMRNKIREVNKQIHGNYAREDRMVIQSYTLGNLAAQFHKWVAPAVRARFQTQYFDENLGWMEGRYWSTLQFMAFAKKQIFEGKRDLKKIQADFLIDAGQDNLDGLNDQKAKNKMFGVYRTMGEIGIILSVSLINSILSAILSGEDDDHDSIKRLKNLTTYQSDRLYKELVLFLPITPTSWEQIYQMASSPIASAKMLGDIGEAVNMLAWSPAAYLVLGKEKFYANSDYVYQNNPKKGQLKLYKSLKDITPIWRTIQKWDNAIKRQDFFIK